VGGRVEREEQCWFSGGIVITPFFFSGRALA